MSFALVGKTFPLASDQRPTDAEYAAIGFVPHDMPRHYVRAVWTGEKRPPRKGEWFLSGAIVEAYKTPADCEHAFHIARLVRCEQVYKIVDRGTYGKG